ncbi:MAG: hypothetical protein AAF620_02995 [Bacteroidota bacterium]
MIFIPQIWGAVLSCYFIESFAKLDFWFKSRLSEFQKRSLQSVNEAFEILSNEELGQKAGFSKDSYRRFVELEFPNNPLCY